MSRYRSALDAGGDPQELGKWMAETRAERLQAEGRIRAITRKHEITAKEIEEMIPQMTEMVTVLGEADPADKNDLYTQTGLAFVYDPSEKAIDVEAKPSMYQSACPRGAEPIAHPFALTTRLLLGQR